MGITDARLASQSSSCERNQGLFSVSAVIGTYYSLRWSTSHPKLLESCQSGQCDTKAMEISTRRQLEHDGRVRWKVQPLSRWSAVRLP